MVTITEVTVIRRRQRRTKLCVLLLACGTVSCSLEPGGRVAASDIKSIQNVASAGALSLSGRVKTDEFNDQAPGKEVPRQGGEIVVRSEGEPGTFNMWLANADSSVARMGALLYDFPLRQNPETLEWEPNLAERWIEEDVVVTRDGKTLRGIAALEGNGVGELLTLRISSGEVLGLPRREVQEVRKGVSFTFFLRRDVRFHDGVPLTAADVKFSFDTITNQAVDTPLGQFYKDLESCEVLDQYTVRVTFSRQYWKARQYAGLLEVLPKHLYDADNLSASDPKAFAERFNRSPHNRKPIGTGRYRFESWETGRRVILTRNPNYWNESRREHLDRIVIRFITDNVAALQALKNGEVHFLPGVSSEQFDEETIDPEFLKKFAKPEYYAPSFLSIAWNMRRPPFDDVKVRQAMAYGALDRQEYLEKVVLGHGILVTSNQYYFGPAYDHSILPHPYDPQKAKQLLLEAGWYDRDGDGLRDKKGRPFRFELLVVAAPSNQRRAAIMRESLRRLGIDMTVRQLDWATLLENANDRKFDAVLSGWSGEVEEDPHQLWHSSQSENRGWNMAGFKNAAADRLIEQSKSTMGGAERRKLFFQLQRILHDQQPVLFFYGGPDLGIYDKRYRGVKLYKLTPDWYNWDLGEWYLPEEHSSP
ncbi:MAG: hypothetical protein HY316_10540 [Acidobacteria bacterium]|nr:hypothetical protein [Acidobacteriota bacterium]